MRWHSRDGNEWYESQVVLPINLDKQLLKFQKRHGSNVFLVVGMEIKFRKVNHTHLEGYGL